MLLNSPRVPNRAIVLLVTGGFVGGLGSGVVCAQEIDTMAAALAERSLGPQQRLALLQDVFGPAVRFERPEDDSDRAKVTARFAFDSVDDLRPFMVEQNDWAIRDGALHGAGIGVSRIVCALPLNSRECAVRARLRSSHTIELTFVQPTATRFDGSRALARLHFGRMEDFAWSDWLELSSGERSLERMYGFRFPDDWQEAELTVTKRYLTGTVSTDRGLEKVAGLAVNAGVDLVALVAVAGTVNNRVAIDELEITGSVDLTSDQLAILTGQGPAFWGSGRDVALYYRARGEFRRLWLNGQVVAKQEALPEIDWPYDGPLHRTTLRLRYGDVLAFKLAGVDDEGALHVVGVDQATGRIVLASHPLTFQIHWREPEESWYRSYEPAWPTRPHISVGQDPEMVRRLRAALGREFPGVPIVAPFVGDEDAMYFKTQVR